MARPIWTGTLSFGLLNVPIRLMPGERKVDLQLRMLDSRDNARIRYERVNAESGEEVPWKDVVKAFEYDKDSYVVLEPEDIAEATPRGRESVDIEAFVDAAAIGPEYCEKPYVLVPGKKAEKGYVLLREVLARTGKAGVARVVIRTREYLSMVVPRGDALMMILLRFPQELVDVEEYPLPQGDIDAWDISARELKMAEQLIGSMVEDFHPGSYRDEFRERLQSAINKRLASSGLATRDDDDEPRIPRDAATNVVDFMSLLKKSIASNQRSPAAKKAPGKGAGGKPAAKRSARKPPATAKKKSATKKSGKGRARKSA